MLARPAAPLPLETKAIHLVRRSPTPRGNRARPCLGTRRVYRLYALSGRSHRPAQCLSLGNDPSGDFGSPVCQIIRNLELYGYKLDSTHLPYKPGKDRREPASLATPDHLQCLALPLVGPLINEEPHFGLGFSIPNIPLESSYPNEI